MPPRKSLLHRLWLKNRLPSVLPATKSAATVVNRAVAATTVAMKNASHVKNVPNVLHAKSVHRVRNARLVKNAHRALHAKPLLKKPAQHHAKSVRPVPHVKSVRLVQHVHLVKTASLVKSVFVNCASRWMPLRQPMQRLAKSVLSALHVKSVNHALLVKNASLVPSRPLPRSAKTKC